MIKSTLALFQAHHIIHLCDADRQTPFPWIENNALLSESSLRVFNAPFRQDEKLN